MSSPALSTPCNNGLRSGRLALGALLLAIGGCRHAVDDRSISQRSINVLLADRFTAGR